MWAGVRVRFLQCVALESATCHLAIQMRTLQKTAKRFWLSLKSAPDFRPYSFEPVLPHTLARKSGESTKTRSTPARTSWKKRMSSPSTVVATDVSHAVLYWS
jgi:hypothetical protein